MAALAKRTMVTGAGAGLGQAVAIEFARRGHAVAIADLDAKGLEATARQIVESGGRSLSIAADLTADDAAADCVARTVGAWGGLDVLVNNAGYGGVEPFLEMTARLWQKTLAINVVALAMLTAAAGAVMKAQRSGRIVNVTSP